MVKFTSLLAVTVAILAVSTAPSAVQAQAANEDALGNYLPYKVGTPASFNDFEILQEEGDEEEVDFSTLDKRAAAPVLTKDQKTILAAHNKYRALHGAAPLTWSTKAATFGAKWLKACQFKHSGGPFGENLAGGYSSWNTAIAGWYNEEKNYNYNAPGFSGSTGHFTQVVWKGTKEVGCAKVKCATGFSPLYICDYSPPGNIVGNNGAYFKKNVLPKKK